MEKQMTIDLNKYDKHFNCLMNILKVEAEENESSQLHDCLRYLIENLNDTDIKNMLDIVDYRERQILSHPKEIIKNRLGYKRADLEKILINACTGAILNVCNKITLASMKDSGLPNPEINISDE